LKSKRPKNPTIVTLQVLGFLKAIKTWFLKVDLESSTSAEFKPLAGRNFVRAPAAILRLSRILAEIVEKPAEIFSKPAWGYKGSQITVSYEHPKNSKTCFGDRAFSVAGPGCWNNIQTSIRSASTLESFKSRLKTHYFEKSYL